MFPPQLGTDVPSRDRGGPPLSSLHVKSGDPFPAGQSDDDGKGGRNGEDGEGLCVWERILHVQDTKDSKKGVRFTETTITKECIPFSILIVYIFGLSLAISIRSRGNEISLTLNVSKY